MARIRFVRVLSVAVPVAVIAMLGWVVADPVLAEAAGIDVWNVGRLEDELREANVAGDQLARVNNDNQSQYQMNQAILFAVINGKRKLAVAAEQLWKMNQQSSGYTYVIPARRKGPTIIAKVAHNIMCSASQELRHTPDEHRVLIARLRAEYVVAFGVSAPEVE